MAFNSLVFLAFFAVFYACYLGLYRHAGRRNALLLAASFCFYGFWDWRFLGLLWFSTLVDFSVARAMGAQQDPIRRRRLLLVSIGSNLGVLGLFKYYDFFWQSLSPFLAAAGLAPQTGLWQLVLPLGISFYTFQTLGYTIDVYRGRIQPAANLLHYALYVAFFPQLVAGPIERAQRLLPQFARSFRLRGDAVASGLFLVVWGYFKKLVIADNLAPLADAGFAQPQQHSGLGLCVAVLAFSLQIYCDFSGYCDIARGIARLLGFDLGLNFRLPYFAANPREFWRRWHLSLSTWLRDYLYIPLGGDRRGQSRTALNLMLTMLLGGLWHGAAWHFVWWGAYHGTLLVGHRLYSGWRRSGPATGWRRWAQCAGMFVCTCIGWVFFRAESLEHALAVLSGLGADADPASWQAAGRLLFFAAPLAAIQIWQHRRADLLAPARLSPPWLFCLYAFFLLGLALFGAREHAGFLYFQF